MIARLLLLLLLSVLHATASASSASSPTASSVAALPHALYDALPPTFLQGNESTIATLTMGSRHLRANGRSLTDDGTPCFAFSADNPIKWISEQGELRVNGLSFHLQGVSWFGFETNAYYPHGLWGSTTVERAFCFLRANSFNAIRIPFSAELALNPNQVVRVSGEPALDNLGNLARLAKFVDLAAQYNLLVMLDMHRLNANGGIDELWYNNAIPYSRVLDAWTNVLGAVVGKWNVFALDLKNEPHGAATWGANNPSTDWNRAAEDMAKTLLGRFPQWRGLIFVEGVTNPTVRSRGRDPNPVWWGGSLEGVWDAPIDLGRQDWTERVVYSPHVYGPDVYDQGYFRDRRFPNNLPGIWQAHFGFAEGVHGRRAVVIGEWGGKYGRGPTGARDKVWADRLGDWMVENCMEDSYFWSLNPNSGDTGGLWEDDWRTPVQPKLDLLRRIQPTPSLLYWAPGGNAVCLTKGEYANPKCRRQ